MAVAMTVPRAHRPPPGLSFTACYEAHKRRVFHLALRFAGGNSTFAEDVTHDVFVKLLEHLPHLDQQDDLGGWLYRVTANLSLTRLRRSRSVLYRFLPAYRAAARDSEPPADELLEQRETAAAAMATLGSLPPKQRVVLAMKVLDGRSQRDIAEALGMSEGYVSKLLARAWAKVRAAGWEGSDE